MDRSRRIGLVLLAVGLALLADGWYLEAILEGPSGEQGLDPFPIYDAATTVGGVVAAGCAGRLLHSSRPPTTRDGLGLAAVAGIGFPVVSTALDPEILAGVVQAPGTTLRILWGTITSIPRALVAAAPPHTVAVLAALLCPLGVVLGHRDWEHLGSVLGGSLGCFLALGLLSNSLVVPVGYLFVLGRPYLLGIPGAGWLLLLVTPISSFVAVDALEPTDGDEPPTSTG